jgi:predicted cupin superfamily sugar epimerase
MKRSEVSAQQIIDLLNLEPLPGEGGYFRQTFKSNKLVDLAAPGFEFEDLELVQKAQLDSLPEPAASLLRPFLPTL